MSASDWRTAVDTEGGTGHQGRPAIGTGGRWGQRRWRTRNLALRGRRGRRRHTRVLRILIRGPVARTRRHGRPAGAPALRDDQDEPDDQERNPDAEKGGEQEPDDGQDAPDDEDLSRSRERSHRIPSILMAAKRDKTFPVPACVPKIERSQSPSFRVVEGARHAINRPRIIRVPNRTPWRRSFASGFSEPCVPVSSWRAHDAHGVVAPAHRSIRRVPARRVVGPPGCTPPWDERSGLVRDHLSAADFRPRCLLNIPT